jgi:N-formylglutamate deformylase
VPTIDSVTQPHNPAETARQWVVEPDVPPVPVVACVPHGGRDFPAGMAGELYVRPDRLWADWLTRELYAFAPELGITTVTTSLSRFVADVNRDPASGHGAFWSSVVCAMQPNGLPVYRRELTAAEVGDRVALAHEPFHRALDAVIERLLRRFPRLLLLDLHSFGRPLDGDVILGDQHGTTARPEATELVAAELGARGLAVRHNGRYPGGWTVRRLGGRPGVDAIQVELNQRCYLDLAARAPMTAPPVGEGFAATQGLLREALTAVADALPR